MTSIACSVIATSANAALIDEVIFTNPETGTLQINGAVGKSGNNNFISLFILDDDYNVEDIYANKAAVKYTDSPAVAFDGTYTHSFDFLDETDSYNIVAVCADGQNQVYPFEYANWGWIVTEIFNKIKSGEMTGNDIYTNITTYDKIIGVDLSSVTSDRDKAILIKRVENNKASFDTKYKEVLENVLGEIDLLNKVETAEHWSEVETALKKYSYISGMSFSSYNKSNKQAVCSELKGEKFAFYENLNTAFTEAVKNNPRLNGSGDLGGGGGGGGTQPPKFHIIEEMSDGLNTEESVSTDPAPAFSDMSGYEWASVPVEVLFDKKIISGDTNGNFNPGLSIKREELVKIAVLAFDLYDEDSSCEFSDVKEGDWFYSYVASAANNGVINGIDELNFGSGANITRQDLAVILYRCAVSAGKTFEEKNTDFADFSDVSEYAAEAVSSFYAKGYINGVGDGMFAPHRTATRAEVAKIVYNILEDK